MPMMHRAAFCTLSGAVHGAWIYFAGNPFNTGRYFLEKSYKIVHFRTVLLTDTYPYNKKAFNSSTVRSVILDQQCQSPLLITMSKLELFSADCQSNPEDCIGFVLLYREIFHKTTAPLSEPIRCKTKSKLPLINCLPPDWFYF